MLNADGVKFVTSTSHTYARADTFASVQSVSLSTCAVAHGRFRWPHGLICDRHDTQTHSHTVVPMASHSSVPTTEEPQPHVLLSAGGVYLGFTASPARRDTVTEGDLDAFSRFLERVKCSSASDERAEAFTRLVTNELRAQVRPRPRGHARRCALA